MKRDLNAILTVLAVGYDVTIKINGQDIGIQGSKSESVKLFGNGSPMVSVLPDNMKKQVCLKEGENSIVVDFKCVDDTSARELTIELQARDQFVNGATLISRKEKSDAGKEKSFTDAFTL